MKKIMLLFTTLFVFHFVNVKAQGAGSVAKWSFHTEVSDNNETFMVLEVNLTKGWHVYSQHLVGDGPIPTSFHFNESKIVQLTGEVNEPTPMKSYDPNFDMEILFFDNKVQFTQFYTKTVNEKTTLTGHLEYMVCDDHMCFPPEVVEFTIDIP